ncbi:MAG: UvrD-helicase domain-containing protein [Candidatus Protochlamydia sp.]|nr:UvrD-helicase domain-containing protein [Candidatus Protochlamydia sp.]
MKNSNFNVLDRQLSLEGHFLLEASAGTGKTFSIQNIVVRLLLETSLTLQEILVVTFTRAATRDLKQRIRVTIDQGLDFLNQWTIRNGIPTEAPDYLKAIMEKGEEKVLKARKRMQLALFTFDQAQIFTIHGFCARMLKQYAVESDLGFHVNLGEDPLPASELRRLILDFFRTEMDEESYSPAQIEILLKEDPRQEKLLRLVQSGYDFAPLPSFKILYGRFVEVMGRLKKTHLLLAKPLLEDFNELIKDFKQQAGEKKEKTLERITHFCALFDQEEWSVGDFDQLIKDGLTWVAALHPMLIKKQPKSTGPLHYPGLSEQFSKELGPLLYLAGDVSVLLSRVAKGCLEHFNRYQAEEEKFRPDDLLKKTEAALESQEFLKKVQTNYQAAIIDEFQDTDPVQWSIFRRLFLADAEWKGHLYLVGDPKQSIYAFRQADIYTYLDAAQALGDSRCFSLNVNYRSQPELVKALNCLFASENIPDFISLPKVKKPLHYQPVLPSSKNLSFEDKNGAVHFFIADALDSKKIKIAEIESNVFFPFIGQEIARIREEKDFTFRQFAVLVKDRHQALRMSEFFDRHGIPSLNQRGISLAESPALSSLVSLIQAVLQPQDRGAVKEALSTPLLGWDQHDLILEDRWETALPVLQHLRYSLIEKGFAVFFQEFLESSWRDDRLSVLEAILLTEKGINLYHDLQQIADILIDHQYIEWNGHEGLVPFLDQLHEWSDNEDARMKVLQDPSQDGVRILTLHSSKGLEFDIVFALGVVNQGMEINTLIPVENQGRTVLTPRAIDSAEYRLYSEECDAEKMRQLYVSLTRAKFQLYIPAVFSLPGGSKNWGEASPLDLFFGRLSHPVCSYGELYKRIEAFDCQKLIQFLDSKGCTNGISYSIHAKINFKPLKKEQPEPITQIPPSSVSLKAPSLFMTSFSNLNHVHAITSLIGSPPHDFESQKKEIHLLPANAATGVCLHTILEKISFENFKGLKSYFEAVDLIRPYIFDPMFQKWEKVLAQLIFNVLNTDIGISPFFCLADLSSSNHYREMPFLMPYENLDFGIQEGRGLMKGVVDLIFMHKGRYYLADWKSNWLGVDEESYQLPRLQQSMEENGYLLQAQIYKEALRRYLKLVEPRPFQECFGGTFYLFLRGIRQGGRTGIYFIDPQ